MFPDYFELMINLDEPKGFPFGWRSIFISSNSFETISKKSKCIPDYQLGYSEQFYLPK